MELQTVGSPALWAGFIGFVLAMLALDLGVFHRSAHAVRFKEALIWSGVWVSLALVFNAGIWWKFGTEPAVQFLTGYLIEKSLSIDNIFVFVIVFSSLRIPALYQHRVLFWGILTALVLRAVMIFAGVAMLQRFHWLIYVFGAFLIFTGVKLFLNRNHEDHPENSAVMKWARRVIPSTSYFDGHHFFTKENGRRLATPLFMALLLVEVTDVIFALDSIPAIFAVTRDPFLVFTSNIFAILGLRSLFFLVANMVEKFSYLKIGLSAVLVFVGAKMALVDLIKIPALVSLAVIATLIGASVVASILKARSQQDTQGPQNPTVPEAP
jgi:tellurite resistance protein TerC